MLGVPLLGVLALERCAVLSPFLLKLDTHLCTWDLMSQNFHHGKLSLPPWVSATGTEHPHIWGTWGPACTAPILIMQSFSLTPHSFSPSLIHTDLVATCPGEDDVCFGHPFWVSVQVNPGPLLNGLPSIHQAHLCSTKSADSHLESEMGEQV